MLKLIKPRRWMSHSQPPPAAPKSGRAIMSGKYHLLYKYLEKRYADTVVLTFAEIEDLLGFSLPELARMREDWWTKPDRDTVRPVYSDSWILAKDGAAESPGSDRCLRPCILSEGRLCNGEVALTRTARVSVSSSPDGPGAPGTDAHRA